MNIRRIVLLGAALAAAGCAPAPKIQIAWAATAPHPAPAATYRIEETDHADAADRLVATEVRATLADRGWRETRDGARWLVEPTYSARVERVGAYAGDDPATSAAEWLSEPGKRRWWRRERTVRSLGLNLTNGETGETRTRLTASISDRSDDEAAAIRALAEAAAVAVTANAGG